MILAFKTALLLISASLFSSIAVKATVVLGLALLATVLARASSAALRHALLTAAFGALLLVPTIAILGPPLRITLPAELHMRNMSLAPSAAPGTSIKHVTFPPSDMERAAVPSSSSIFLAGWIVGTIAFLVPVIVSLCRVRALRKTAIPWQRGRDIAAQFNSRISVEILLHDGIEGPLTCGVLRPAILLPIAADTWREEDLHRALLHEMEHVCRCDWFTQCVTRLICALYWFHPLVWIAQRKLVLEAERCCDDAVLRISDPIEYADQLVDLAQRLKLARRPTVLAMANRADLSNRIASLLNLSQRRGPTSRAAIMLIASAATLVALAVSPLRMIAAPELFLEQPPAPQAPTPVPSPPVSGVLLRTVTNLVMIDVTVMDQAGNVVEGLTADDFVLREDGVIQKISVFEFQKVQTAVVSTANDISSYYVLGYYSPNRVEDGRFRRIAVSGKLPNMVKLDYRAGHYAVKRFEDVGSTTSAVVPAPNVRPPAVLFRVDPEYSEEARKAKYQGTVDLSVVIDETGKVTSASIVKSLGMGLDEKAVAAVMKWRFRPGTTQNSDPIAMQANVTVTFRLL